MHWKYLQSKYFKGYIRYALNRITNSKLENIMEEMQCDENKTESQVQRVHPFQLIDIKRPRDMK